MKFFKPLFVLLVSFSVSFSNNSINYFEPAPGAEFVSIGNNIIIGFTNPVNTGKNEIINSLSIIGTKSGIHNINVLICENGKKIILTPAALFEYGEKITVKLTGKLINKISSPNKEFEYSFYTSPRKVYLDPLKSTMDLLGPVPAFENGNELFAVPQLTVRVNNNPSEGSIFLTSMTTPSYLIITDKNGSPYWSYQKSSNLWDFKKQPNGHLTYFVTNDKKHYEINGQYNIVDTYYCGNGYDTDPHELRVLENGHALVMAYDAQTVDMSKIVQGGNPNATVVGLIIQEIDINKNVIFQWRSWDHIPITDVMYENLLAPYIDYVHGNAIEMDTDGNLMISSRHLNEITKINRATGNIMWRLGGTRNQFTFINDTLGFSFQHAVRRLPNGNITIFDNGNYHTPQFSRVIEYRLDEINKTAELVWQYRNNPDVYGSFMGYAQRLDNGNTLIGWGGTAPTVTEVTPAGNIAFEMSFPQHIYSYRAYKFDWNGTPLITNNEKNKIPEAYNLQQNYPNPFNPVTSITYDVSKESFVELSVFDITGKEVKKIISGYQKPGSYSVKFDASKLSSGLYIYRLNAGEFTASKKMILIK